MGLGGPIGGFISDRSVLPYCLYLMMAHSSLQVWVAMGIPSSNAPFRGVLLFNNC